MQVRTIRYEQYVTTGSVDKITAAELYNNYTTMLDTLKKIEGKKKKKIAVEKPPVIMDVCFRE